MSDSILVSIVTPSYNQAEYLLQNLRSVAIQRAPGIELQHLVMDGGSNDGTLALLEASSGVTWMSEKDRGQSDAINKGFRAAQGAIIGWINSDDYYEPGAIAKVVAYFREHPETMWLYGKCHFVDSSGTITDAYDAADFNLDTLINRKNFVPQQSTFFRRELLEQVGYLDESLHLCMDYDYWIRFGKRYPGHFLPEYLASFRRHADAKTSMQAGRHWAEFLEVSRKHGGKRFSVLYLRMLGHAVFRSIPGPIRRLAAAPALRLIVRRIR